VRKGERQMFLAKGGVRMPFQHLLKSGVSSRESSSLSLSFSQFTLFCSTKECPLYLILVEGWFLLLILQRVPFHYES